MSAQLEFNPASLPDEELADYIAIGWRDHAQERAYLQYLQCVLRDRMTTQGVLKMKTPHGTTARLSDPQYTGTPSQRKHARGRDAGPQIYVKWSAPL